MRKRAPLLLFMFCAVLALAGVGVYAEMQKGQYQPAILGQFPQAGPSDSSPDSQYGGSFYPLYPPELEAGEGKTETDGYCGMCHSTRYITMQPPLPAAAWEAEVTKMKKSFGATIPDEATSKIVRYLQAHYTPETRKE